MASKFREGKTVDHLTLIRIVDTVPGTRGLINVWECRCDCGNTVTLQERTLVNKTHVHSCGCYQKKNLLPGDKEVVKKAGKARAEKRNKDGCNVDMLFRERPITTNTSGVQGISWSKTANKWHVYVGYQNRRANLGFYEDINDAKEIRELALAAIREGNFEEFFFRVRGKPYSAYKRADGK